MVRQAYDAVFKAITLKVNNRFHADTNAVEWRGVDPREGLRT